jgi:transcriptional regulator with XRE-family HTH domain
VTQNDTIVRSDRASNQSRITQALAEFKTANKRLPTQEELAERTGLSRTTVQRRLRDIDFGEAVAPLRLYLQDVLLTIAEKALAGDMRAAKLFLQVSYGWSEKDPSKLLPEKEDPTNMNSEQIEARLRESGYLQIPCDYEGSVQDLLKLSPAELSKACGEAHLKQVRKREQEQREELESVRSHDGWGWPIPGRSRERELEVLRKYYPEAYGPPEPGVGESPIICLNSSR